MARTPRTGAVVTHNAQNEYVKQLEARLAEYESRSTDDETDVHISPTEYVKVMSLLPYRLNLCTRELGQGKVYRFDTFGQVKKIIYSDLSDILEVCRKFLESGYFIILNNKVVRANGLDELQSKILTKEKITEILEGSSEAVALYASAKKEQQEVIVDMVVQKLADDPSSVDMNVVDKLARVSDVDIMTRVADLNALKNTKETK